MISNYLKISFRNLLRHKGQTILNVVGLAVGFAGSVLIMMYVNYELSYDGFNSKAGRIYRVYKQDPGNVFMGTDRFAVVPAPAGKTMEAEFPEVESSVKFAGAGRGLVRIDDKVSMETGMFWVEPSVFTVFDYPLVKGDPATALTEPNTVVISEDVAGRYFGTADPIGRVLRIRDTYDMHITGVMKDIPANSHLQATMFLSFATYAAERGKDMNWGNSSYFTYLLLREGADPQSVREKMPAFVERHMGEQLREWGKEEPTRFILQPLGDIHLHSMLINMGPGGEGDIKSIYILTALALVLLVTASINYINLTTARASLRAREVGIRKVVGAGRMELVRQFIGESILTSFLALIIAMLIVELILPFFSQLVGRKLTSGIAGSTAFLLWPILLALLVGIASGAYPAFVLSGFSPIGALKGVWTGRMRSLSRNALVVLQFTVSIALAVCAFIIWDQLNFIRTVDPGYNREQVLAIRIPHQDVVKGLPALEQSLRQIPGVVDYSTSTHLPIDVRSSTGLSITGDSGTKVETQCYQMYTDEHFLETFKIPLIAGRFLGKAPPDGKEVQREVVVNEAFGRTFGLKNPVGTVVRRDQNDATIVGVVKDFHLHSFRQAIAPLFIGRHSTNWVSFVSVRMAPTNIAGTMESIRSSWAQMIKSYPLEYTFVDESFNKMYEADVRLGKIVSSFTLLALFVAAMGLFGLATFVAQLRRKEIAVRKVLGASAPSVVTLLSREFMLLVGVANVLAWPASYLVMNRWLSEFSYRTSIGIEIFLLAGAAAALIALSTVSLQAVRAAWANPVESLRYE